MHRRYHGSRERHRSIGHVSLMRKSMTGVLCLNLAQDQNDGVTVSQVRWDTEHGFHVPDLLCKDCDSLEDMIKVRA